jgi:prephenate dehydratase
MKCTLALAMRNIPGAIFKMSSCFAFRELDINRIESRPATVAMNLQGEDSSHPFTRRHWDLVFFIDFEPSSDNSVNNALRNNLLDYCEWVKDLGTYRSNLQIVDVEPSSWTKDMLSY